MRLIATAAILLFGTALVLHCTCIPVRAEDAASSAALRFEISFPKQAHATPLDGRILLLISNNDRAQPRFLINGENPVESQQMFGVDVESLAPGAAAVVDSSTLGYPAESLSSLPTGAYWGQGLRNITEPFLLATCNKVNCH